MSTLSRIERAGPSLADEAYDRLVQAIASGDLRPGDRLVQDRLAEQLNISRTPVRDALLRLEREGVVEPAERRGYLVRELTADEIEHLYQAREAVEGYAARKITEMGEQAVAHFEATLARAATAPARTQQEAFEANRAVHRAVVEATGNRYLLDLVDEIWGRSITLQAWAHFYTTRQHEADDIAADHKDLLEALRSGSGERAEAVMIEHIREGYRRHMELAGGE